jgi:hypothetical protein
VYHRSDVSTFREMFAEAAASIGAWRGSRTLRSPAGGVGNHGVADRAVDAVPTVAAITCLTAHQPSSGIKIAVRDDHALMPRRNPEDIDLGAIKADLEFLIERFTRFRKEQALKPLYTMVGTAAIVIAWIELFWRHCL